MKKLLSIILFVFLSLSLFPQVSFATDYYTSVSTNPNNVNAWWTNTNGTGSHPANFTAANQIFNVQNGHIMTGTSVWTVSGSGSKVIIKTGGRITSGAYNHVLPLDMESGAYYLCNHSNYNGLTIGTLNAASTFELSSNAINPRTNITYGNFVWNSTGLVSLGTALTVGGDLTIKAGELRMVSTIANIVHSIGGNIIISGGGFVGSHGTADVTINVGKGFQMTSGVYRSQTTSGICTFNFNGTGTINFSGGTVTNSNQIINISNGANITFASNWTQNTSAFTIASGGICNVGTNVVSGTGSFVVSSGGTIASSSATGLAGNVTTSTATFSSGGNYTFAGTHTGTLTTTPAASTVNNLTVSHATSVTLDQALTVAGTLAITTPALILNGNNLTINGAKSGSGTITGDATSYIAVGGSGALGTSLSFTSGGRTLAGLTIDRASQTITLGSALTLEETVTIGNGSTLTLGTNTLTGSGGAAAFSGTGTISLDAIGQVSGFSNSFAGTYYLTGTNSNVPSGTYSSLRVNGGGATLSGDVVVSGALEINGPLTVGAHKLTFSGSTPIRTAGGIDASDAGAEIEFTNIGSMILPGSLFTGNVNKLTMSGSGLVTSPDNITVAGTLALANGFLDMGVNTLTLGTSTSNTGTLTRSSGAIRGSLKRWFAPSPVTDVLFPLDNGSGAYSQAKITFNSLGTGGTLTSTFHNSGSGSLPGGFIYAPEMHVNLINLAPQYWTISAGDGLANPNYNLELTGDAIPNISDLRYIAIVKRPDSGNPWTWTNANYQPSTGSNTNPVLYFNGGTSFSDFGVGGNVDNLLPVELQSFTSSVNRNSVKLNWSTVSEENNSGFDIERKNESSEWKKITNVQGHGTSNNSHSYSFEDRNLITGKYNYRLKQIDYNGNYKYYDLSNEVIVGVPGKFELSQNYPNPFNPTTKINYELPNANFVSLKIYDMTGREVMQLVNEIKQAGYYTAIFNASMLSSGTYFYRIQAGDFSSVKKMMLVK